MARNCGLASIVLASLAQLLFVVFPSSALGQNVDIVFLIDGSDSATTGCEWPFERLSVARLFCGPSACGTCNNSNLPHDGSHWASVVQFADTTASVEVSLQSLANAATMCSQTTSITKRGLSTPLAAGFQKAIDIFNASSRPTAERVVVVLTDHKQDFLSNEEALATTLRTLSNPARISIARFGTPAQFDPVNPDPPCGTPCPISGDD